jgi:hypothetical protein
MARLPRIVLPGIPHHVTQRGNRRERVFFEDGDYALYLDLLAEASGAGAGRDLVELLPDATSTSSRCRPMKTACGGPFATCTAIIPAISMCGCG